MTSQVVIRLMDLNSLLDVFMNSDTDLLDRIILENLHSDEFELILDWMTYLPPVFNDAIMIWRAWVLGGRKRWALYLSTALCVASFEIIY
ncbi:hypothetical protein C0991_000376 [Blastosporella zonata]|nr:hypothetical protein C0991_000376 [Blastosporella zonata]